MTRQEAIKELENISWSDRGMEAIYMAIDILEQEPKWIPVTERLPEIGDTVIISGKMKYKGDKDYEYFVDVAFFEPWQGFSTFNDWYEGQDEFEIVAWQPLPEPYKESEEE